MKLIQMVFTDVIKQYLRQGIKLELIETQISGSHDAKRHRFNICKSVIVFLFPINPNELVMQLYLVSEFFLLPNEVRKINKTHIILKACF